MCLWGSAGMIGEHIYLAWGLRLRWSQVRLLESSVSLDEHACTNIIATWEHRPTCSTHTARGIPSSDKGQFCYSCHTFWACFRTHPDPHIQPGDACHLDKPFLLGRNSYGTISGLTSTVRDVLNVSYINLHISQYGTPKLEFWQ